MTTLERDDRHVRPADSLAQDSPHSLRKDLRSEPQRVLHGLIVRQRGRKEQSKIAPLIGTPADVTADEFFTLFDRSGLLRQDILPEARTQVFQSPDRDTYRSNLAGMTFAKMATGFLASTLASGEGLVVPALRLCEAMNPDAEKVEKSFDRSYLQKPSVTEHSQKGIYVPDGFVVSNDSVVGVIEAKLSKDESILARQVTGYRILVKRNLKGLYEHTPNFVIMTPQMKPDEKPAVLESDPAIVHVMLPFTYEQFGEYIWGLLNKRFERRSPTLHELWKEKGRQSARFRRDANVVFPGSDPFITVPSASAY